MTSELEFTSHPGNLCLVRNFVREFLKSIDLPDAEKDLMVLGLDEACTNVIRYAYEQQQDQLIVLGCERGANSVTFRLRDFGKQCPHDKLCGRPLDLVRPGGLGIHLIKRAFTEVDYRHLPTGTELVMTRRMDQLSAS